MTVSVSLILSPSLSPCAVVLALMTLSSVHCAGDNPPCGHTFPPFNYRQALMRLRAAAVGMLRKSRKKTKKKSNARCLCKCSSFVCLSGDRSLILNFSCFSSLSLLHGNPWAVWLDDSLSKRRIITAGRPWSVCHTNTSIWPIGAY